MQVKTKIAKVGLVFLNISLREQPETTMRVGWLLEQSARVTDQLESYLVLRTEIADVLQS